MIRTPEIFVSSCLWSLQEGAEAGRGEAEQDEDRREAGDEEQAGAEHAAPAGVVELGRGDAGHGREVAGDERQHAGGEEGDDSRREGGEDAHSSGRIGAENRGDQDPSDYPQRAVRRHQRRRALQRLRPGDAAARLAAASRSAPASPGRRCAAAP